MKKISLRDLVICTIAIFFGCVAIYHAFKNDNDALPICISGFVTVMFGVECLLDRVYFDR